MALKSSNPQDYLGKGSPNQQWASSNNNKEQLQQNQITRQKTTKRATQINVSK